MKKILIPIIILGSFNVHAYTEQELLDIINSSIEVKKDLNWTYNTEQLKKYETKIKNNDIDILKKIASGEDKQLSQGSKYLLATQGNSANEYLIENYLSDSNLQNSLYYLNMNFLTTTNKEDLWDIFINRSNVLSESLITEFKSCYKFKDYYSQGGKDLTFDSIDDYYDKKDLVRTYTFYDLFDLELEFSVSEFPITVTFYNNRYVVQSKDDDKCININENESYVKMQKIMGFYKKYQKQELIDPICDNFDSNSLLKTRFNYYCLTLK